MRRPPRPRLRRLPLAIALLLVAAIAPIVVTSAPATAAPVQFTSTVVNAASNLCAGVPGSSTANSVQLSQSTCASGATNQSFTFVPVTGATNTYTVDTFAAGKCLDISGQSLLDNGLIIQWSCNSQTNQQFRLQAVTVTGKTNTFNIIGVQSGKCLIPAADSTANNALLVQLTCSTATTRVWQIPSYNAGTGTTGVTVTNPGTQSTVVNTTASLALHASGGTGTFTWTASGLPAGLALNGTTGVISGTATAIATSTVTVTATSGGTSGSATFSWTVTSAAAFKGMPAVDPNACHNTALPKSYGTNFPTPADPHGLGFSNQTTLGWDGNYWPVFEYLSGSFFARGVPSTYASGSTSLCGGMYSFSAYTFGGNPAAQSVQWTQDSGYLPAMKTTRTSGSVVISIKDFADKVTINGNPFMLMYARVSVTNNGSASVSVPPGGSGPNLIQLTSTSLSTVAAGATNNNDFVVAVDNFGTGVALPTGTALSSVAPSYDTAYNQMAAYWNGRLAETTSFTLPNTTLPNTGNLASPGTAMINAFKAGTIYNLMMQVGEAEFSAANNYAWLLNHDVPGELEAKFETGDFHDAQNLLLTARISEQTNFNEVGANWYWDGVWKTVGTWADYLQKTNDTAFVNTYFHDDASATSPWGPSLYTIVHTRYAGQLAADGTLATNFDNDSTGRWLFSNYSALEMLAAYKYIATRLGLTSEATFANTAYTNLLNSLNTVVGHNESVNGFNYLPCEVDKPNTANRCNTYNDANWASPGWIGQNQWSTMLMGGPLSGVVGDPTQIDNMYAMGYARLASHSLPYPTLGAFNGYSTAYNTSYSSDGLYSNNYRDLAITSYAWQIATTTGGPNAWWEANGSGPSASNPWIGNHAGPQFGACPYGWPISGQQMGLQQSIAAEGLTATGTGPYTYTRPLYIGRGIPNTWIAAGQTIAANNLTSSYTTGSGSRSTYGVSIAVTKPSANRIVTVNLTGTLPGGAVSIQLPIFLTVGVNSVAGGTYSATTHTVTVTPGTTSITITLAS